MSVYLTDSHWARHLRFCTCCKIGLPSPPVCALCPPSQGRAAGVMWRSGLLAAVLLCCWPAFASTLAMPKTSTMNLRAMRLRSLLGFDTRCKVLVSCTPLILTQLASPRSSSFCMAVTLTNATPRPCCTAPLIASTEFSSCKHRHNQSMSVNKMLSVYPN